MHGQKNIKITLLCLKSLFILSATHDERNGLHSVSGIYMLRHEDTTCTRPYPAPFLNKILVEK